MAKRSFYRTLSIKPIYQTDAHTWDFITSFWVWNRPYEEKDRGPLETIRNAFIAAGCSICAYAMYMGITPESATLRGQSPKTSPFMYDWPGTEKIDTLKSNNDYAYFLARRVLIEGRSAIVAVPGHFAVVSGFNGGLSISPEGLPHYDATPLMIRVIDPYMGQCTNLQTLMDSNSRGGRINSIFI